LGFFGWDRVLSSSSPRGDWGISFLLVPPHSLHVYHYTTMSHKCFLVLPSWRYLISLFVIVTTTLLMLSSNLLWTPRWTLFGLVRSSYSLLPSLNNLSTAHHRLEIKIFFFQGKISWHLNKPVMWALPMTKIKDSPSPPQLIWSSLCEAGTMAGLFGGNFISESWLAVITYDLLWFMQKFSVDRWVLLSWSNSCKRLKERFLKNRRCPPFRSVHLWLMLSNLCLLVRLRLMLSNLCCTNTLTCFRVRATLTRLDTHWPRVRFID